MKKNGNLMELNDDEKYNFFFIKKEQLKTNFFFWLKREKFLEMTTVTLFFFHSFFSLFLKMKFYISSFSFQFYVFSFSFF